MKNCKCGCEARIVNTPFPYVECNNAGCGCWSGPARKTKEEAEEAWDAMMGEPEAVRKPVGGFVVPDPNNMTDSFPWVVCDDGSVFYWVGKWKELPPIPGTTADKEGR